MSDVGALIAAIAALVTALGGVYAIVKRRPSPEPGDQAEITPHFLLQNARLQLEDVTGQLRDCRNRVRALEAQLRGREPT